MNHSSTFRRGLTAAVAAYVAWGLLPLYFRALHDVPPVELIGWRILFTLPVCLVIVAARRQGPDVRAAFANPRVLLQLAISAALIGANWLIFVIAINEGHVLATSLGYYINPLINVLLGTMLLGERLSRVQWTAVGLAGAGIALLLAGALDTLIVAMSLALTFAFYGYVRKKAPVGSVPGLTVETALLALPALVVVWIWAGSPAGSSMAPGSPSALLLAFSGVATAIPLLLFAVAARALPLSTLGFVQFIAPTISFTLGLTVFGESLDPARLGCFALIWSAIALYSWDMLRRARSA
ncbi:rarD protein [Novosphingobium aromaticivorans DSM 12444]|uniref:RarD protein n=1 Tax=Novosphingobium aromaticivorans (strain ATCC 700278 / DSM 12444 / CCUG 56034 / CIP 105152 / NBRC 16084 / F199) TaxID=279238 RepID=Q2G9U2_NOVAD|nr:EamA family transporter RarD [Novosphingobium aromaticivorans]ABD25381.1 rarD protein [Novosphingobium aromaticivorans DSM 12444]SCX91674.1 chloramphenicol-sensitive protein RarD [Novosphingobium aromaticivorans]